MRKEWWGMFPPLLYKNYIGVQRMLIEEEFEIKINNKNINYFRNLGYEVSMRDVITVPTSQLSKGSHVKVLVQCDYCEEKFRRIYKDYLKFKGKLIDKDACKKCRPQKAKENNMAKYGVESIRHVEEINNKIKETNIERYGVETPFESEKIREKGKQTTLKMYGVDNFFKVPNFKEIQEASMLKKYGYRRWTDNPELLKKATEKYVKTMYENGTAPASRQQVYINDVLGGVLNYPYSRLMLDIAFPEEKIYVEFQGSGHDLDVQLGKMSEEQFKKKDINRYYFMKREGWKMIEIISANDMLPYPYKLLEILEYSRSVLKDSSYIVFDLDNNSVKIKGEYFSYDYGEVITQSKFRGIHDKGEYEDFLERAKLFIP